MPLTALLMPGMDGTARLFRPLLSALPAGLRGRPVPYPEDRPAGYEELEPLVPLPREPFVIIAESFSGPLAIRIAARGPEHLRGLVLVATFVRPPLRLPAWLLARLIGPRLFGRPPPPAAVRALLLGPRADAALVSETIAAIASVAPAVLAARLRAILSVDVARELREVRVPILHLAGRQDRLVRAWSVPVLRSLRPDARFVTIDGPHLLLQREPAAAAEAIAAFVRGVRRADLDRTPRRT